MAETFERRPNYGRRILWLGIVVVAVIAIYTAGWFYAAGRIEQRAREELASISTNGVAATCENPTARGYPFRIGLYCNSVSYSDAAAGITATAGAFRSAGQIYDPMHLVAELDAPAVIQAPGLPSSSLNWTNLRASVRLSQPLPERVSVEAKALSATVDNNQAISARSMEGHMRPNGAALDIAARFNNLVVNPQLLQGRSVPSLTGEADVQVANGVAAVQSGVHSLRGQSGIIRGVSLTFGTTGSISVAGPFAIDGDGLLDATLSVALNQPAQVADALAGIFPEARNSIQQGFAGLATLGAQPKLPLRIAKGNMVLGFIPLGHVPPLR